MDTLNQITSDCFNALRQLRELEGHISSPEMIHNGLVGFIEAMRARGRDQNMPQRDVDDIAYGIVALADEIALGKPEPMRGFWMQRPLQLHLFNDALAGEGFFNKLADIRRDPRRADVLRAYYQVLLLGFQGKYLQQRGGDLELMRLIDAVRPEVERHVEVPDVLSPAGEPPDEPLVRSSQKSPFLWVALGVFALAIAVFIGLRVSLDHQVSNLAARVDELNH
jgi:type VI secretion system protein ImpK